MPKTPKTQYARTLTLYLTEDLDRLLEAAYRTRSHAWKRNAKGRWIHKSKTEFVAELLKKSLDNDATMEGSRVALAGKIGAQIGLKLDNLLLLLRAFLDLFCLAARITETQKNEAFKQAAADVAFDQRLTDLRAFYHDKLSETGTETAPNQTSERDS